MYQKAIVTFIDILGFSNLVKQSDAAGINRVLDALEKSTFPLPLDDLLNKDYHAEVVSFSDSIVRIRKIETKANQKYPIGLFFQELMTIVHAQGELIGQDIIIRGGVSVGNVYISGTRVFGPGLIEAYNLESQYAMYPRIIIDPHLIQEYKSNKLLKLQWHSIKDELKMIETLLRQGDDGMWFVDYASVLEREFDELEIYLHFLQKHRDVILSGVRNCYVNHKLKAILGKYVWMANYHNQIIFNIQDYTFKDYDLDKKNFIITSEEIPALQYMKP